MKKLILCMLFLAHQALADVKEIAITIDDLPLVASKMDTPGNRMRAKERFDKIVDALKAYHVPATGFVIAGSIGQGQWEFLEAFKAAGLELGSHTYSHPNLNIVGAERYIKDLDKADQKLAPIMTTPKYFRYPYLAEGRGESKGRVLEYLNSHQYIVAPVTIDSKDFRFNEELYRVPFRTRDQYVHKIKPRYLAYIWSQTQKAEKKYQGKNVKQILLLHANVLNSYLLPDILEMYKKNGYTFVPLGEAIASLTQSQGIETQPAPIE